MCHITYLGFIYSLKSLNLLIAFAKSQLLSIAHVQCGVGLKWIQLLPKSLQNSEKIQTFISPCFMEWTSSRRSEAPKWSPFENLSSKSSQRSFALWTWGAKVLVIQEITISLHLSHYQEIVIIFSRNRNWTINKLQLVFG